jgi:hypothetical protein
LAIDVAGGIRSGRVIEVLGQLVDSWIHTLKVQIPRCARDDIRTRRKQPRPQRGGPWYRRRESWYRIA